MRKCENGELATLNRELEIEVCTLLVDARKEEERFIYYRLYIRKNKMRNSSFQSGKM